MECLKFLSQFIALVMECISTYSFELLLNHSVAGSFFICYGLRQDDLLSFFYLYSSFRASIMHTILS